MSSKSDQIADALIHDVLAARYRVGERLPSERDLVIRFDANRGAVREAMAKVAQLGLVDVLPGGARVRERELARLPFAHHHGELVLLISVLTQHEGTACHYRVPLYRSNAGSRATHPPVAAPRIGAGGQSHDAPLYAPQRKKIRGDPRAPTEPSEA